MSAAVAVVFRNPMQLLAWLPTAMSAAWITVTPARCTLHHYRRTLGPLLLDDMNSLVTALNAAVQSEASLRACAAAEADCSGSP